MSHRSRRSAGTAAVAVLLIATGLIAGCGGSDSDGTSEADKAALQEVTAQIEAAAQAGDVEAFCDLVQPSLVEAAFDGRKGCLRVSESAVDPESPLAQLDIDKVVTDGDGAIVTYTQDPPGKVLFAREEGTWYVALDEIARARKEAQQSGSGSQ